MYLTPSSPLVRMEGKQKRAGSIHVIFAKTFLHLVQPPPPGRRKISLADGSRGDICFWRKAGDWLLAGSCRASDLTKDLTKAKLTHVCQPEITTLHETLINCEVQKRCIVLFPPKQEGRTGPGLRRLPVPLRGSAVAPNCGAPRDDVRLRSARRLAPSPVGSVV